MKLEVGMYVRTKWGYICEIININDFREPPFKYGVEANYLKDVMFIGDEDILKASHNIIDLIEPMDLMFIDISPDDCGGIVIPRVAETEAELKKYKKDFASGWFVLKGVVTREQIKTNTYWVDDEVETIEEDKDIEESIKKLGKKLNGCFKLMVESKKYYYPKIHEDLLKKEDKEIEELNLDYYHDEPANIDDLAYKVNEVIKAVNELKKGE